MRGLQGSHAPCCARRWLGGLGGLAARPPPAHPLLPVVISCCAAIKGEGLFEGLDWLSNTLKTKR